MKKIDFQTTTVARFHRKIVATTLLLLSACWSVLSYADDEKASYPPITPSESIIFAKQSLAPWQPFVGSAENWMVPHYDPQTSTVDGEKVTVSLQEDSKIGDHLKIEWRGQLGQFVWQSPEPKDYQVLSDQNGAITMALKVEQKPSKKVDLKMDCGYPCAGSMDMTKLFQSLPLNQWVRISVNLSCFDKAGADLSKISSPLVLATEGKFTVSFLDVRLITNAPKETLAKCS